MRRALGTQFQPASVWGHYRGVEVSLHQIPAAMRSQAEVTLPVISFIRASWAAQTCLLFKRLIASCAFATFAFMGSTGSTEPGGTEHVERWVQSPRWAAEHSPAVSRVRRGARVPAGSTRRTARRTAPRHGQRGTSSTHDRDCRSQVSKPRRGSGRHIGCSCLARVDPQSSRCGPAWPLWSAALASDRPRQPCPLHAGCTRSRPAPPRQPPQVGHRVAELLV